MTGTDPRVGAAATADGSGPTMSGSTRATTILFGRQAEDSALVPTAIVLHSDGFADGVESFRIQLVADDGTPIHELGPFTDEDAIAIWRSLAGSTGLPLVIAGRDGRLHMAYDQIGPVQLGQSHVRRRFAPLSGRRPRFLIRRKSARLPRRPLVYREPELAARQDGR